MKLSRRSKTMAGLAALAMLAGGASVNPAIAAPTPSAPKLHDGLIDGGHDAHDKDNRFGVAAPSFTQRAAANKVAGGVSWGRFGTPHALTATAGTALADGLSADPEAAARQYIANNEALFGLTGSQVASLEKLLVRQLGSGTVVHLRQRFGNLEAGPDGLIAILVKNGSVLNVSSSLSRDMSAPEAATLTEAEAVAAALADAEMTAADVSQQSVRLVAVPMPGGPARSAYEVTLIGSHEGSPTAFTTYIDGRSADVLVREDLVDFDADNPKWAVFPVVPPATLPVNRDPRVVWCFAPAAGCERTVSDPNSGQAWDVDLTTGAPTFTSSGNAANNVVNWGAGNPTFPATPSPNREYRYPFTDQWRTSRCNPNVYTSAQRNDADAAVSNLFAMHNRMHDWAWHLGFTESAWNMQVVNLSPDGLGNDAEQGRAQAGAISGSRNNANQGTPRDGLQPTTNMFLWQPIAGSAYPPCVDGDYDMTVIGHEYSHAITNRMIAGPNSGIGSFQGGAMGESWSDMLAGEYLFEFGFAPPGGSPFVTGGYVTGNFNNGIRNYDITKSPLNYSDVGYDRSGPGVHADGEIWGSTQMRIREAFMNRYGKGTPSSQRACAEGRQNINACPGNRRWVQLMFDSFLLQASNQFSMLDMRDNMLAADLVRFEGANQDLLWNGFAESGMGIDAASGPADTDPTPSFASPFANNATVTLRPLGTATDKIVRLYVGDHEARAVPIADTDPETELSDTFQIVPSKVFRFLAVGDGLGARRFTTLFLPGRSQELRLDLPTNLAANVNGAVFSGDGVNLDKLGDETETTNWAATDGVAGKRVTVDLTGDRPHLVTKVNVSALLRPQILGDADPVAQNAFSALRSFEVWSCIEQIADCSQDSNYFRVFVSSSDAFPAGAFRPFTPQLNMRTFHIFPTVATHIQLRVRATQCTGGPLYAGEQDNDPNNATDCATASPAATQVRIAELQVFTR